MTRALTTVATGIAFAEGPRWHEGRLWFSDMHAHQVMTLADDGKLEPVVDVPNRPSGLGWDPEGRLLIVSMTDRRLLRVDPDGSLAEVADLGALATGDCNDMVVDAAGRAYIGNFGFEFHVERPTPVPAVMIAVEPDGTAHVAAEDLMFPNGTVMTPDGRTLIVGESFAGRLTAFDVQDDGSLINRRVWAQLEGAVPDGICLDAEGAIWVSSPLAGGGVLRVREGGEVVEKIPTGDRLAIACMLGGPDRTTLYVCTATTTDPERCAAERSGRIEAVEVDVPGAGLP